jgi:ComF family protein
MFGSILNRIIDFVLPPVCLCCESPVENGVDGSHSVKFICPECYGRLERFDITHPWRDEYISAGVIDNSLSAFWFREGNEIQTLMHEMKYGRMKSVGRLLGREIANIILSTNGIKWDYVIPVPLHKARLRDRTYNQSEFIAESIAGATGTKVLAKGITRTRFTGTQTKLNKQQRKENVKDAFSVNPRYKDSLTGKNIILVDDVITTGATILECASTLKNAGAGKIWVCSAAYAELNITS